MVRKERIVRATADEIEAMRARGEEPERLESRRGDLAD